MLCPGKEFIDDDLSERFRSRIRVDSIVNYGLSFPGVAEAYNVVDSVVIVGSIYFRQKRNLVHYLKALTKFISKCFDEFTTERSEDRLFILLAGDYNLDPTEDAQISEYQAFMTFLAKNGLCRSVMNAVTSKSPNSSREIDAIPYLQRSSADDIHFEVLRHEAHNTHQIVLHQFRAALFGLSAAEMEE